MFYSNEDQNRRQLEALGRVKEKAMSDPIYAKSIIESVISRSDSSLWSAGESNEITRNAESSTDKRDRFS